MKKITAAILSMAVASASMAVPVLADYTASDYDIEILNETFNSGTAVNGIDRSAAIQVTDYTGKILETTIDSTKEFFLSFDFCMNGDDALIEIPKYKSSGVDKVGPRLKIANGTLVTETSSTGTQALGECAVGSWYTAEIEGRTGMGAEYTTFRLYKYEDGVKTLVQETPNFNMRNLSSEGRSFSGIGATNVSLDNFKLISEKPDVLTILSDSDSLDAGQALTLDYEMTRLGVAATKYDVTWAVYDESGENEVTDGSVSMNGSSVVADISSPTKTVTVKASAVFGEKTLSGDKQITINSVNTDNEVFDAIVINGADSVKAGTSSEFTVTASKQGSEVTVTDADVVWSLYDSTNIHPYTNSNITLENGVLTVADGVIAHDICLRASSVSGKVYGYKPVSIAFGDSQLEAVEYYNAFEAGIADDSKQIAADGSSAYLVSSSEDIWQGAANHGEYLLTSFDIRFTQDNSGIVLMRRDGAKTNTEITYSGGNIKTHGEVLMTGADTNTWYHIEVLYSSDNANASCNIYPYNDDGTLGTPTTCLSIDTRNAAQYGRLRIQAGSCIDNVVISSPLANEVTITSPGQYMFAGESKQFNATASRNGLPILNSSGLTWTVLDSENLPILDGTVSVDQAGLVTADAMAESQKVTVRVTSSTGASASAELTIQTSEIFSVTNLGVNEAKDKIVRVYVNKNFYYDDDVTFIITIYGQDGTLKAVKLINTFGDRLSLGANELTTELELPADFDSETDTISAMVWTNLGI